MYKQSVVCVTVYEPTTKKSTLFKPLKVNGKVCRRVPVSAKSTVQDVANKLKLGVSTDDFTEIKHQDDGSERPVEEIEYTALDVAQWAVDFAQGKVCDRLLRSIEHLFPC
jgi:hypothetical protein